MQLWCSSELTFYPPVSLFLWVMNLDEGELKKRIEEMERLIELMKLRYEMIKRDNEVLRKAIEELKIENERLRRESSEG